ncbi:MAG: type I-E CRISPR-associated protein Cas7/Cse4/CasC [Candidatus Helarchaeota archaeon]|nr:type I-E CRISPR-associated protein Cas7/Cse4/CasC [Candidatus Helarchaeota archaeon]
MFVELHMIQNFGPSCLNRDDTNTPKDCQFGGFRRARISSQCLKRAIRKYFTTQLEELQGNLGVRTRMLPKKVIDVLIANGKDEETATTVTKDTLNGIGFKTDSKDPNKTEVILFLNNNTHEEIANIILKDWDAFSAKKVSSDTLKKLDPIITKIQEDLNADIALFGRMVASKTDLNVDSSCYVAHALSTHKVEMEMDFFTAIDDLQEETESGAGMMGIVMYNSSCFYRYAVIDLDQLAINLQGDRDKATMILKGFIQASVHAIPTGKQTSMAAFNLPDFIMATIRKDQPWSLVNAFVEPARLGSKDTDLVSQSITKFESYLKQMSEVYGSLVNLEVHYCYTGERPIQYLDKIGTYHKSVKELIESLGEKINEHYSSSS